MKNNHRVREALILTALVLYIAQGCTNSPVELTKIPESDSTSNLTFQATVVPIISTPLTSFQENLSCWPIMSLESGGNITGSILFEDEANSSIWDMSTFNTRSLEGVTQFDSYVSPDGEFIAHLLRQNNKILLISEGKTESFTLPDGKYRGVQFLINGSIMIEKDYSDLLKDYKEGSGFLDEYYLLDPLTGSLTTKSVLLKEFATGNPLDVFPVEYSPDLRYVIYPVTPYKDGKPRFARMDLKTQEVVWTGSFMPHWMPDGKTLTYLLYKEEKDIHGSFHNDNFYSLSENGSSIELTQFARKSLASVWGGSSWSSNGRYLIFRETQPGLSLFYVWDDKDKIAFRPCLPDENRSYTDYHSYWSPDGSFIFLRLVYPDYSLVTGEALPSTTYKDLILDLSNKKIFELPNNQNLRLPVGWINWEVP